MSEGQSDRHSSPRLDAPGGAAHDASMRTPLTPNRDVTRLVEEERRASPHVATLQPGFERAAWNSLADELEDADLLDKLASSSSPLLA